VKTRLACALGHDVAYELYLCFLADISTMTRQVHAQTIIVYSGPAGVSFPDFPDVPCLYQRGRDIGEHMYFALQDVFALGFERCVLTGSDIPDLPAEIINDALEILHSTDVVLGPSTDGGYYLVGCNKDSLRQSIFSDIPWSTDGVFPATLKRIAATGLAVAQLPEWSDIDEIEDLKAFYQRNSHETSTSRVIHFLKTKGIINEL